MEKMNIGVTVGHRSVFPGTIAEEGRKIVLEALGKKDLNVVILGESETKSGVVSCREDAVKYSRLFSQQREALDGIIISLPDFGDESSLAQMLRLAQVDVPVFVHAFPDGPAQLSIEHRRDAFCGKISVCNNLHQFGIRYTVGDRHVTDPRSESFEKEIEDFLGVCRVVKGLRNARIGCIGARTTAFNTVRFSEKILERNGISTVTVDLSDIVADVEALADDDPDVQARHKQLGDYVFSQSKVPQKETLTIAKLSVVVEKWAHQNQLDAYAIQCWPSMQKNLGIYPCVLMSLMSDRLLPSACETDVMGAISMYALQLASGTPSGLFDLNNNYGDDDDKMVLFHCSNCPISLMKNATAAFNAMSVRDNGLERSYSTLYGSLAEGPFTFARLATDDFTGTISSYIGVGDVVNETLETFGTTGVMEVKGLQQLLKFICRNGFEHHFAINAGRSTSILHEAFENYLGWRVYHHNVE